MMNSFKIVRDTFQRPLRDLRISVTDRCNFRCRYCMPVEVFGRDYEFLPKEEVLRYGEISRVAKVMVELGVRKIRLTGGEPLLRRDLHRLVSSLSSLEGVEDIAMTTNAALLAEKAKDLKTAGLDRVTVSLDAIDRDVFASMNGVNAQVVKVQSGIEAALAVGLGVKINAVVKRGTNDQEVGPLVKYAQEIGVPIRFIEYMDTGNVNQWKLDEVLPSVELLERLREDLDLTVLDPNQEGETAQRYSVSGDYSGFEVGFISSVSQPFCQSCNRIRLSASGELHTCLFTGVGHDIKGLLRSDVDDEMLKSVMASIWAGRKDRYSEQRSEGLVYQKKEMSYLGG